MHGVTFFSNGFEILKFYNFFYLRKTIFLYFEQTNNFVVKGVVFDV
jgi:hypothetical protein